MTSAVWHGFCYAILVPESIYQPCVSRNGVGSKNMAHPAKKALQGARVGLCYVRWPMATRSAWGGPSLKENCNVYHWYHSGRSSASRGHWLAAQGRSSRRVGCLPALRLRRFGGARLGHEPLAPGNSRVSPLGGGPLPARLRAV